VLEELALGREVALLGAQVPSQEHCTRPRAKEPLQFSPTSEKIFGYTLCYSFPKGDELPNACLYGVQSAISVNRLRNGAQTSADEQGRFNDIRFDLIHLKGVREDLFLSVDPEQVRDLPDPIKQLQAVCISI
jgi:hypothetical protein